MTFEQAAQNVANDLGWVVAFVVWTVVVLAVGRYTGHSEPMTDSAFQEHKKLYESQFQMLREPDEHRGLGYRETDHGVELIRIAEKDGNYYEASYFTIYTDDIETVANTLSYYVCEQEREVES